MDGDVKSAGCGDSAADAGECYRRGLVVGDVGCGFGNKHERFFEAVEETFAGFDRALDAILLVVASSVSYELIFKRKLGRHTSRSPLRVD